MNEKTNLTDRFTRECLQYNAVSQDGTRTDNLFGEECLQYNAVSQDGTRTDNLFGEECLQYNAVSQDGTRTDNLFGEECLQYNAVSQDGTRTDNLFGEFDSNSHNYDATKHDTIESQAPTNSVQSDMEIIGNSTENEENTLDQGTASDDSESLIQKESKTFSFRALTYRHKLILLSVCLCSFFIYVCLSMMAPFFPKEARERNVSDTVSGWIFGIFPLTQIIFSQVSSRLMPYLGTRRMYNVGTFIVAGTTIMFGVLAYIDTTNSNLAFVVCSFLLRVVMAIGCSCLQNASLTICGKEFSNSFSTVFGIIEIFVGVGYMSGPGIGGLLYEAGGFVLPFAVVGGLMMLCVPLNMWLIPREEGSRNKHNNKSKVSTWTLLMIPKTWINSLVVIIAAYIYSILEPTLEPHLYEVFNLSAEVVGLLFVLMSFFYAITSPVAGGICDHVSDNRFVQMPGLLMSIVAMLFLGPSDLLGLHTVIGDHLWLTIVCTIALGVGVSLALIPSFGVYFSLSGSLGFEDDQAMYGTIAGIWGSAYAIGEFLGPSVAGALLEWRGFPFVCTSAAVLCLCLVLILIISWSHETRCCQETFKQTQRRNTVRHTVVFIDEASPLVPERFQTYLVRFYPQLTSYRNLVENDE